MNDEQAFRVVGKVLKAHGLRGEFILYLESDFPEWLMAQPRLFAEVDGGMLPWRILRAREHKGQLIMQVDGLADRTAVEAARDTVLYLPESEARAASDDPDFFFNSDLVGLTVMDEAQTYGTVALVIEKPGQNLLEVSRPDGGTFLFPFAKNLIADIDLEQGHIRVHMPEGLVDCNRPDPTDRTK